MEDKTRGQWPFRPAATRGMERKARNNKILYLTALHCISMVISTTRVLRSYLFSFSGVDVVAQAIQWYQIEAYEIVPDAGNEI